MADDLTPTEVYRSLHNIESLGDEIAHRAVQSGILKANWREIAANAKPERHLSVVKTEEPE